MTRAEAEEAARRAAEWVRSEAGQKAVADSLERARRLAEQFRKAQEIDPAWQWLWIEA